MGNFNKVDKLAADKPPAKETDEKREDAKAEEQAKAEDQAKGEEQAKDDPTRVSGAIQPMQQQVSAADVVDAGEETVTMLLPKEVRIQDPPGRVIVFPAGVTEVPIRYKDHWYLKAHGVKEHKKGKPE